MLTSNVSLSLEISLNMRSKLLKIETRISDEFRFSAITIIDVEAFQNNNSEENIPHEISYKVLSSKVSLGLLVNPEVRSKSVKFRKIPRN